MKLPRETLILSVAAVGAACAADGSAPIGPTTRGPEFATAAPTQVVASATGNGIGNIGLGATFRVFGFTAQRRADGSVTGEFQLTNRDLGLRFNGHVLCLTIVGNAAWIGVAIDRSNTFLGEGGFRVQDLGDGARPPVDELSLLIGGASAGFAANYCASTPADPPLLTIESGEIRVRS